MASLIRGGANAGPWRNEELCPRGIPRREEEATEPPKARTSSPFRKKKVLFLIKETSDLASKTQTIS